MIIMNMLGIWCANFKLQINSQLIHINVIFDVAQVVNDSLKVVIIRINWVRNAAPMLKNAEGFLTSASLSTSADIGISAHLPVICPGVSGNPSALEKGSVQNGPCVIRLLRRLEANGASACIWAAKDHCPHRSSSGHLCMRLQLLVGSTGGQVADPNGLTVTQ